MWTVQRMTENAVPSPNWFSLPHLPSHLKNQIPPSLFPLLSHPLSQTWIMNAPALRCFDSPIFKTWSPHVHLFLLSSCRLCLSATVGSPALPVEESQLIPRDSVACLLKHKLLLPALFYFPEKQAKKNSCSMHLLNVSTTFQRPSLVKLCLLLIPHFYQQRLTFLADPVKQHCFRGRLSTEMDFLA